MKILIIGSGGREHALAWSIFDSPLCDELIIAPGNPGIAQLGRCEAVSAEDTAAIVELATVSYTHLTLPTTGSV